MNPHVLAASLAAGILLSYAAALWWLLRREPAAVFVGLALLCSVALSLRLVYTGDFPAGLNDDEPKNLVCSVQALHTGNLVGESCNGPPYLLSALFAAPLVPIVGANRWAIRTYSLVLSVLAVPAAFAFGRALGQRAAAALTGAALLAVLPWSIYYGRISLGGELVFHQLLLLTALARLVWPRGRWPEAAADVAIGAFGLCLLLYGYFAGRVMLGMPLLAALLATGWRRAACLAVAGLAVLGWLPHVYTGTRAAAIGLSGAGINPQLATEPWVLLWNRYPLALQAFVWPTAKDDWFTVRGAAMHPPLVLVLAGLGLFAGVRRGLFLLGGFAGGVLPAVIGDLVSVHRMMMAFPFVTAAAAWPLDWVPWRRLRAAAAVAIVAVAATQSVRLYFSPAFWPFESRVTFDRDHTALMEALAVPPGSRLIADLSLRYFLDMWRLDHPPYDPLAVEHFYPPDSGAVYAFSARAEAAYEFYARLAGPRRTQAFGWPFMVRFEPGDWSWLRAHGWRYDARCGEQRARGQVPVLVLAHTGFAGLSCPPGEVAHVFTARWDGAPTRLRLFSYVPTRVDGGDRPAAKGAGVGQLEFEVARGGVLRIELRGQGPSTAVSVLLSKLTPGGEVTHDWEDVTPVGSDGSDVPSSPAT